MPTSVIKKWARYPTKLARIKNPTFPKEPARSSWEPTALAIKDKTAKGVILEREVNEKSGKNTVVG